MAVITNRSFIGEGRFVSLVKDSLYHEPDGELVLVKPEFCKKDLSGMEISGLDHALKVFAEDSETIIILVSDFPKENFIFSRENESVKIMMEDSRVGYIERPIGPKQVFDLYRELVRIK